MLMNLGCRTGRRSAGAGLAAWWMCGWLALFWTMNTAASVPVRMETVFGDIDIELLDDVAPLTVANFLNYVDGGDYNGSIIHRNGQDGTGIAWVVQGGAFTFDPALGGFIVGQGLRAIPTDPPVQNEFQLSNTRGTIAMAKVGGDPDSATSQWFFNVKDNSANLDVQNEGFTVFARVLGDGMDIVDRIAELPIRTFLAPFNELPLIDHVASTPIQLENVVVIDRVYRLGVLAASVASLDMGEQLVGASGAQRTVELSVTGGETTVTIGDIGTGGLVAPFGIVADACSGQVIGDGAAATCALTLEFAPSAAGDFSGSLEIPSNSATPLPAIPVSGRGVAVPTPNIAVEPQALNLGSVAVGESGQAQLRVENTGSAALNVSSVNLTGAADPGTQFMVSSDCEDTPLEPSASCTVTVNLVPFDAASETAFLEIASDDPDTPLLSVEVRGTGVNAANIVAPPSLQVGHVPPGQEISAALPVTNTGDLVLEITTVNLAGDDAGEFSVAHDCGTLVSSDSCQVEVSFLPASTGEKDARLEIASTDPDTPLLEVTINAAGASDTDGVLDSVEDGHPRKNSAGRGDGNEDGIADATQASVTSLPDINGKYVTLVASDGAALSGVSVQTLADLQFGALAAEGLVGVSELPARYNPPSGIGTSVDFDQGYFSFRVIDVNTAATVTMILPEGSTATHYFKFGVESSDPQLHWYAFNFDGTTGAEFAGNRVILHFVDGFRGDNGLDPDDGIIIDPGGPALVTTTVVSDSGGGNGFGCSAGGSRLRGTGADAWLLLVFLVLTRLPARCRPHGYR